MPAPSAYAARLRASVKRPGKGEGGRGAATVEEVTTRGLSLTPPEGQVMLEPRYDVRLPARPAHPHRDRPPSGSRVGRMGRQAAPRQWRFLRSARCVLPVCRLDAGARRRRRGGPDLRARASSRGGGGGAAPRPVAGPRRGHPPRPAVVRPAAPFLLLRGGSPPPRTAPAPGLFPPPQP